MRKSIETLKNIWNIEDVNGIKIVQKEREAAEKPDGDYIYYSWHKPTTNKSEKKVSFVKGVREWRWMVGAGLYIDDIEKEAVIQVLDAKDIYEVPLNLRKEGLDDYVMKRLGLDNTEPELEEWKGLVERIQNLKDKVTIALVGKYVKLQDAYLSVMESLKHAGIYSNNIVEIKWINAEHLDKGDIGELEGVDGILIPGGFGERGLEGKIKAIKYARENDIPMFGICLGMHMTVVEFARNVCGLKEANSSEVNPEVKYPVIDLLPEQKNIEDMGGTMRLGLYPCKLVKDTLAAKAYDPETKVMERHRHRYEFNNDYREILEENGLVISGLSPDKNLVEIVELKDHRWFLACQFHPEFMSRPNSPHPLFRDFIAAAILKRDNL